MPVIVLNEALAARDKGLDWVTRKHWLERRRKDKWVTAGVCHSLAELAVLEIGEVASAGVPEILEMKRAPVCHSYGLAEVD